MDKKEILEKSQQENRNLDERDRQIEQKACTAGYRAVLLVNACIILLLAFQAAGTGEAFISWWPFALATFTSQTVHDFTLYRYHHKTLHLIGALVGAAATVAALIMLTKGY